MRRAMRNGVALSDALASMARLRSAPDEDFELQSRSVLRAPFSLSLSITSHPPSSLHDCHPGHRSICLAPTVHHQGHLLVQGHRLLMVNREPERRN